MNTATQKNVTSIKLYTSIKKNSAKLKQTRTTQSQPTTPLNILSKYEQSQFQLGLCMVMLSLILYWSRSVCLHCGHEWIQPGELVQRWSWNGGRLDGLRVSLKSGFQLNP